MRFKKNNKGFSLVELILVLGLSSLIFLGVLAMEKRRTETLRAESAGQQIQEVGTALSNYISNQKALLTGSIPSGTTITLPLTVLQGVTSGVYVGRQYLPTSFNTLNAFGTGYILQIRNNGGDSLTGIVITDAGVQDETGAIRYDWLGYAARVAGAQSGMSFFTNAQVTGLNAGWTLASSDFNSINAAGKLAYRSQYQGNYDDIYLRRDGLYPMTGNLNMGNHNIRDATDINFYGYLNGNQALLNSLQTGYIHNTGNIQNDGTINTLRVQGYGLNGTSNAGSQYDNGYDTTALGPDTAEFSRYVARHDVRTPFINRDGGDVRIGNGDSGRLYVKDIFIRNGGSGSTGRAINSWLSDRLPRYVSRGEYYVYSGWGVAKPNCGTGVAKIEVIAQNQWIQGRVFGTPQINTYDVGGGNTALYLTPGDQYSVGGNDVYAVNYGSYWVVYLQTPQYAPGYDGGRALAHVYCDMGT